MSTFGQVFRFTTTGVLTAVLYLTLSYLFKDIIQFNYIVAATIAYCIALIFNFLMQKFWSFRQSALHQVHFEAMYYLCWSGMALLLNLLLIYVMVSRGHLWYLFAQAVASIIVASASYVVYKHIFRASVFSPE